MSSVSAQQTHLEPEMAGVASFKDKNRRRVSFILHFTPLLSPIVASISMQVVCANVCMCECVSPCVC